MIINPTFQTGFARNASQSAYPWQWTGIIGVWCPCLGVTGTTLRDWSRFAHHGILTNMDPATAWLISEGGKRSGYVLDFHTGGSDESVVIPDHPALSGMDAITISTWSYPRTTGDFDAGRIIDKADVDAYDIRVTNSAWQGYINGTSKTAGTFTPNAWIHVVLNYDGAAIRLFFDGLDAGSPVAKSGTIATDASDVSLGDIAGGGRSFDGLIDDVRIYNRSLSAAEIQQIYQLGRGSMFQLQPRKIVFIPLAVVPGNNGNIASTANPAISSASGTVYTIITGNIASTASPAISNATGDVVSPTIITGNIVSTTSPAISSATGDVVSPTIITGNIASIVSPAISSATGSVTPPGVNVGNIASTANPAISSAAGTVYTIITGNIASIVSPAISNATGTLVLIKTGNIASTANPAISSASGTVYTPLIIEGSISSTVHPAISQAYEILWITVTFDEMYYDVVIEFDDTKYEQAIAFGEMKYGF